MPIKYPTEFKVKAIRRYEKGESIKELCKELNISQSTLYHWRKQYCSIQTDTRTYTPAEFDAISKRLRKVEHELSFFLFILAAVYPAENVVIKCATGYIQRFA